MLRRRSPADPAHRVVAVGEWLPFGDARFDGVFSINVLEHVADLDRVLTETVRVLAAGGSVLAVTPNGNWEGLLDLAERWSLKIPEGPHQFLTTRRLRRGGRAAFEVVEHRTILVLPAGPPVLSSWVDAVSLCSRLGRGLLPVHRGPEAGRSRGRVRPPLRRLLPPMLQTNPLAPPPVGLECASARP